MQVNSKNIIHKNLTKKVDTSFNSNFHKPGYGVENYSDYYLKLLNVFLQSIKDYL